MLYLCGNHQFVDAAHHTQNVHYAFCHVHCTVQLVDTLIVLVVGRAEYQRFRSAEKVCTYRFGRFVELGVQGVLICTSNGGYLQAVADISGR